MLAQQLSSAVKNEEEEMPCMFTLIYFYHSNKHMKISLQHTINTSDNTSPKYD